MLETITKLFKKVFGTKSEQDVKAIQPFVDKILEAQKNFINLTHDELREKTLELKARIAAHIADQQNRIDELRVKADEMPVTALDEKELIYNEIDEIEKNIATLLEEVLNEILPEAFAIVKETARRFKENAEICVKATDFDRELATTREHVSVSGDSAIWLNHWTAAGGEITWDMVHYDVQLIGGVALHQGKIAEMATGEGKTLVATLPVYLNALTGRGVHLVTVNDYLAKRDSEWMGPIFEFHGLTVDCIDKHQPNSDARRKAYRADITYGTNNEFGFDYLRDNMAVSPNDLVQRKHHFAIVDEVDSVLIDDARTPLIISGPTPKGDIHEFTELKPKVERLVKAQREFVNGVLALAKKNLIAPEGGDKKEQNKLQEEGGLALLRAHRGLPKNKALIKFLSEPGMKAQLQKTENFYMQDNNKEMPKADAELFFVIDERSNSIELTEKGIDLITDSSGDKNFFVLPDIGSAMADIEKSAANEQDKLKMKDALMRDYSIKVERVHTINQLLKAYCLFELDVEYVIMDNKIKIVDEQTGRIMEGRRYSDGLHQAIEAKENVRIEAATQTYATVTLQNYFRMYHKLAGMTGTAETEAGEFWEIYKLDVVVIPTNRQISRKDMDDKVYKTAREKYNAVIEEIVNLTGQNRPVLVGTTSVEVSELLSRMLKMRGIKHNVLNAKLHAREAEIVAEAGHPGTVTIATNMAGRGTDIKLRGAVKDAGGLAIIGTERHESRRVDRQLRGRAGRQGDPGSSQFFVSLEDNLMRLFGSDRIAKLMDRLGLEEGEVIQHSMISKSIERAQKKVEENNFGVRKRLLEYDDVMNNQREVIYKKRRHALFGERMAVDIANSVFDVVSAVVNEHRETRDFGNFKLELIRLLSIESPVGQEEFLSASTDELIQRVYDAVIVGYQQKSKMVAEMAYPVLKNVFETQSGTFENIVVPFTDGMKTLQVVTNLRKAYLSKGEELSLALEKSVTLAMIDHAWKEHLREMDDLRQSVQGAVYEQKDPLLIYKFESFELFKQMLDKVNKEIVSFIVKASLPAPDPSQIQQARQQAVSPPPVNVRTTREDVPDHAREQRTVASRSQGEQSKMQQPVRVEKTVGRNDECPCGSGKKFKNCHGK